MIDQFVKGLLFSACLAALLSAHPVKAQTSTSSSNANSSAGANSGSTSSSVAGGGSSALNSTSTTNTNTGVGVGLDNRSYSYGAPVPASTTSDVTVRTTPTVYAPPVSGGNPCTLAVSGGVSVIGWGASAGGTFVDQDCANRQKIAMVHNAGYKAAGKELMCDDKATYVAFKTAGEPCAFRAAFEPPGAAPQPVQLAPAPYQPAPTATYAPPPVAKVYPRCDARRGIVDNCAS